MAIVTASLWNAAARYDNLIRVKIIPESYLTHEKHVNCATNLQITEFALNCVVNAKNQYST